MASLLDPVPTHSIALYNSLRFEDGSLDRGNVPLSTLSVQGDAAPDNPVEVWSEWPAQLSICLSVSWLKLPTSDANRTMHQVGLQDIGG